MELGSNVLLYLANVSVRSLALTAVALAGVLLFRPRSAAARHAICTLLVGGMLLLGALEPLLPSLPLHILPGDPPPAALPVTTQVDARTDEAVQIRVAPPARQWPEWQQVASAIYAVGVVAFLLRLAFGYLFARRLARASQPINRPGAGEVLESSWISVPLTVGLVRPKILLPTGWDQWNEAKLEAVLAHERTHVQRGDWAIGVMAGINRSIFWFHPLAWWLERKLAFLAEQAADDAALLLVETDVYAQTLLDMASAVNAGQGRLIWEAMAMANRGEVRQRIERILDETRQIPKALTRFGWVALVSCSLPLIYMASAVQLAPAQSPTPPAIAALLKGNRQLTAADASQMEQYLAGNPHDLNVRSQLVLYYFSAGIREPRLSHILWLIANHPESNQALFTSRGITPRNTTFNDAVDYNRAAHLWTQQVGAHPTDARILSNAAEFFSQSGDLDEAERLLTAGGQREPGNAVWTDKLGRLYAAAIIGNAGDARYPELNSAFAQRVKRELENSTDGKLLTYTGRLLTLVAQRSQPGRDLPPGLLNLDDHPMLVPVVDLGNRLIQRGLQYGGSVSPVTGVISGIVGSVPAGAPPTGSVAGVIRSVPSNGAAPSVLTTTPIAPMGSPPLTTVPPLVHRVEPVYPEQARQNRIQGDVRLSVTIAPDGHVQDVQTISGHPLMVPPAVAAVKQWIYGPTPEGGRVIATVPFRSDGGNQSMAEIVEQMKANSSPPSTEPSGPPRVKIGGSIQEAKLLTRVDPVYPQRAREVGIEGSVSISVLIAEEGTVLSAEPLDGHPLLVPAAIEAVRKWTYRPTLLSGNQVQVMTTVTVPFRLP